jgi:hypothetical protein
MPSDLSPEEDRPVVPIAPPVLFVLPIVASLVMEWLVPTTFKQGVFRWNVAAIFFVAGLALNIARFVTQKRAAPTRSRSIRAHASSQTGLIVSVDVHRLALWTLGLAFLVDCARMLLALPFALVLIDRLVITHEERYLERKFGEEYLSYKRRVRRWI